MTMLPIIRSIVTSTLPGLFHQPATLHVYTEGDLDTPPTFTDYTLTKACFRDSRQFGLRGAGVLNADEGAILFYREKLPSGVTLKTDDAVTLTDLDETTQRYKLLRLVDEDPAQATQIWATVDD